MSLYKVEVVRYKFLPLLINHIQVISMKVLQVTQSTPVVNNQPAMCTSPNWCRDNGCLGRCFQTCSVSQQPANETTTVNS
jgi:hypothetical protein